MIARVHVLLRFFVTILDGENYSTFEYQASGHKIRFLQPQKSPQAQSILYRVSVDQRSAYQADVLIIEFQKESFDRAKGGPMDPHQELILEVTNSFIRRLRAVARAAQASELVELSSFRIEYLNDDGSKLPEEEGLVRGWGGYGGPVHLLITDEPVWNAMKELPRLLRGSLVKSMWSLRVDAVLGVVLLKNSPQTTFSRACLRFSAIGNNLQFFHRSKTRLSADASADGEPK